MKAYRIVFLTYAGGRILWPGIYDTREAAQAFAPSQGFLVKVGAASWSIEECDETPTHTLDARGRLRPIEGRPMGGPGAAYFLTGRAQAFADRQEAARQAAAAPGLEAEGPAPGQAEGKAHGPLWWAGTAVLFVAACFAVKLLRDCAVILAIGGPLMIAGLVSRLKRPRHNGWHGEGS